MDGWVAVLPGLDPTTMGWKERGWYLPEAAADAFDRMGNAGPTLWVDGRVVGAWAQTADGELRTHLFEPLPTARAAEVEQRLAERRGDARRHPVHGAVPEPGLHRAGEGPRPAVAATHCPPRGRGPG